MLAQPGYSRPRLPSAFTPPWAFAILGGSSSMGVEVIGRGLGQWVGGGPRKGQAARLDSSDLERVVAAVGVPTTSPRGATLSVSRRPVKRR